MESGAFNISFGKAVNELKELVDLLKEAAELADRLNASLDKLDGRQRVMVNYPKTAPSTTPTTEEPKMPWAVPKTIPTGPIWDKGNPLDGYKITCDSSKPIGTFVSLY